MVEVRDAVEPLAPEWDALADRVGASPFLRPGWVAAWWRAFGSGSRRVFVARRDGELTGVLPAFRRLGVVRSMSNAETPQAGLLAADRATADALLSALFAAGPRRVRLEYVDHEVARDFSRTAARAGYRASELVAMRSPYVAIQGDWESYEASLRTRFVSDLRRRRRRLAELGSVTLQVSGSDLAIAHLGASCSNARSDPLRLLREGFAIEGSEWKERRGTAIASRSETLRFYTEVAEWADARGFLRLAFLRLDGRALAFQLGIDDGRAYHFVKGGYDRSFLRFAPGKLLAHAMLERAFRSGLGSFEFLGQDEEWKLEWATGRRERAVLEAHAASAPAIAERFGRAAHRRWIAPRVASGSARRSFLG